MNTLTKLRDIYDARYTRRLIAHRNYHTLSGIVIVIRRSLFLMIEYLNRGQRITFLNQEEPEAWRATSEKLPEPAVTTNASSSPSQATAAST